MDALMTRVSLACQAFEVTDDERLLLMRAAMGAGTADRLPKIVMGLLDEVEARPVAVERVDAAMVASAGMEAHFYCDADTYCRNPLHPGPCKGWTRQLGTDPTNRRDVAPVDKPPNVIAPRPGNRPPAIPADERRERRRIQMAERRAARRATVQGAIQGLINAGDPGPRAGGSGGGRGAARSTSGSTRPTVAVDSARVRQQQADIRDAVQQNRADAAQQSRGSSGDAPDLLGALQSINDIEERLTVARRNDDVTARAAAIRERDDLQVKALEIATAIWGIDDTGGSGLKTRVNSARIEGYGGNATLTVGVTILDANGFMAGNSSRSISLNANTGKYAAYHGLLSLNAGVQGGGFASRYNGQAFDMYRKMGVHNVGVHADLDVGGYTWASQGFDFSTEESMRSIASRFRRKLGEYANPEVDSQIRALLARSTSAHWRNGDHPTPYEWSQVGATCCSSRRGGRRLWPGKSIMLRSDWNGVKAMATPLGSRAGSSLGPEAFPPELAVPDRVPAAVTAAAEVDDGAPDGPGWAERQSFLEDVWDTSAAYADEVADAVPGCTDAEEGNPAGEPSEVPAAHHLMCAPAELDAVLVELGQALLDDYGRELDGPA